jgi:transposase
MILDAESWMNIRRFRALHDAGATYAEIAAEVGCDWRTVKKYLAPDAENTPPTAPSRRGTQPRRIDPYVAVVEGWLRADVDLRASVIHERLVDRYGFVGSYQRVKLFCREVRPRIVAEIAATDENRLAGLHRRFEVVPGAQAQVDWGDEGAILAHVGIARVYSFHMVLSYSRDPFCCFTTSMNAATWWDCHRRAFAHFGGVPAAIVYDRTKTVVKQHVRPGAAVPLHPDAAAFAGHYGFTIDVLAAYRPTGKGRVERQVHIVREHVLAGLRPASIEAMDAAFAVWLPIRRGQVHRTHGELIAARAIDDRAALAELPPVPFWWSTGTCAEWARTVWSRSRPASTRYPPPRCGPGSGSRSAPAWTPSPSTRSRRTPAMAGRPCWPRTGEHPSGAAGSSTHRIGTGCPTGTAGPPRPNTTPSHGPHEQQHRPRPAMPSRRY